MSASKASLKRARASDDGGAASTVPKKSGVPRKKADRKSDEPKARRITPFEESVYRLTKQIPRGLWTMAGSMRVSNVMQRVAWEAQVV